MYGVVTLFLFVLDLFSFSPRGQYHFRNPTGFVFGFFFASQHSLRCYEPIPLALFPTAAFLSPEVITRSFFPLDCGKDVHSVWSSSSGRYSRSGG